jgi:hypothetical protein
MDWMNQITGLLGKYGDDPRQYQGRDDEVQRDFDQVAGTVPRSSLAEGLAAAFRSDRTPPFSQMLGQLFGQSGREQKAGILNQLLSTGAASGLLGMLGGKKQVSPEEADRISPDDVQRAAEETERRDPSIVDRLSEFYADHPGLVKTLGAGALAIAMSRLGSRRSGA